MKTELFGTSNAILEEKGNGLLAIITCKGGKKDIAKTLKLAIKEHFCLEDGTDITLDINEPLTNQKSVDFEASWEEDGEPIIREFEISIIATYKS